MISVLFLQGFLMEPISNTAPSFSPIFQLQEVRAVPDMFAWQVLKNTTKKGFLHRQPSLLLFPWSNYFQWQTWKSSAAVSDHVEKCLHYYSCLCCLAKESKLAQVQLPSAQSWYVDHSARCMKWAPCLNNTLLSLCFLPTLPLLYFRYNRSHFNPCGNSMGSWCIFTEEQWWPRESLITIAECNLFHTF